MVPHVFEYSGVSKPKFLIPIEHQVDQQCRSTNAIVVMSFAATTSKRQFPAHILLPEHFRKLCRSIVGPPSEVDGNAAWNEIRHLWNGRVKSFVANARVNTRSYIICTNYWNLAKHVASLRAHRRVQRLLSWHPFGTRRVDRPRNTWESQLMRNANMRILDIKKFDNFLWNSHLGSFVHFCACK